MSYLSTIQRFAENPEELELTYQQAVKAGKQAAFAEAIEGMYAGSGANLLLAAWHYRLTCATAEVKSGSSHGAGRCRWACSTGCCCGCCPMTNASPSRSPIR